MKQITYGTKEFQDAMDMFERTMKISSGVYVPSLDRETRDNMKEYAKSGQIVAYNNGDANKLFKLFLSGINYGIALSQES